MRDGKGPEGTQSARGRPPMQELDTLHARPHQMVKKLVEWLQPAFPLK